MIIKKHKQKKSNNSCTGSTKYMWHLTRHSEISVNPPHQPWNKNTDTQSWAGLPTSIHANNIYFYIICIFRVSFFHSFLFFSISIFTHKIQLVLFIFVLTLDIARVRVLENHHHRICLSPQLLSHPSSLLSLPGSFYLVVLFLIVSHVKRFCILLVLFYRREINGLKFFQFMLYV